MPANIPVLKRYIGRIFRITKEESEEETKQEILSEVNFKGATLWLLVFTMILTCVGLNMNSIYAIIGAMLMSPLMAPVIGLGFAIATNDWPMVKRCARNWLVGFGISLLASTLYFSITPFNEPTEIMTSFTGGTIYDVLIAFFGGLAGFIGLSRVRGMKVMAGVAVATACMPPLSTAGYGIANFQWSHIWGGSYFYIINCVFIGLAVMLLAKYMQYKKVQPFSEKPVTARIVYVIAFISLLPAAYFAWQLVQEKQTTGNIERFIKENLVTGDMSVLKKDIQVKSASPKAEVYITGHRLTEEEATVLRKKWAGYQLTGVDLVIHETADLENLENDPALLRQFTISQEKKLNKQDSIIATLSFRLDSMTKVVNRLH